MQVEDEAHTCNGRSWEEHMYWTHFQFTHFCRFLHSDFHHSLAIPTKFSNNMSSRLPGTVTLRGPSGMNWTVCVAMSDDGTLFFSGGWKEFALDHGLQASDLLIFRYNGHSQFDVLVLETESSCEKANSYFVPKRQRPRMEEEEGKKKGWGSTAATSSGAGVFIPSPEQHDGNVDGVDNDNDDDGLPPPEQWTENDFDTPPPPPPPHPRRPPPLPNCPPFITELSNKQAKKVLTKKVANLGRSGGAESESKLRALRLAKLAVTKDGFLTVMRTTHVERTFYLAIPYSWTKKHMDERVRQDMILRMGEEEWPVKFKLRENKNAGGLTNGWKKFARDNRLQRYDVCVFDFGERRGSDPETSITVLKVEIFR